MHDRDPDEVVPVRIVDDRDRQMGP